MTCVFFRLMGRPTVLAAAAKWSTSDFFLSEKAVKVKGIAICLKPDVYAIRLIFLGFFQHHAEKDYKECWA